jgi:DNA-binding NarL/FixJ family response regulator
VRFVSLRCLIVDDSPEFLDAARGLLQREGVDVVGVASRGADAIRLADELKPDVTLVDIDLGGEDGLEVARLLARDGSRPGKVILISTHAEDEFAELIEASPAIGFIAKSALSGEAIKRLAGSPRGTE